MKTIKLKNGIEMPVLGFGVCQVAYFIATRAETEPEKIERTFDCLRGTASGKFLREKGDRCHRTMAKGRNERFA